MQRIFDIYCQSKDVADFHNVKDKLEAVTLRFALGSFKICFSLKGKGLRTCLECNQNS